MHASCKNMLWLALPSQHVCWVSNLKSSLASFQGWRSSSTSNCRGWDRVLNIELSISIISLFWIAFGWYFVYLVDLNLYIVTCNFIHASYNYTLRPSQSKVLGSLQTLKPIITILGSISITQCTVRNCWWLDVWEWNLQPLGSQTSLGPNLRPFLLWMWMSCLCLVYVLVRNTSQ